jgi:Fur family transcriptional regulator, ferric uptake regulator
MPTKLKTRRETGAREQLNDVGLKVTTQRLTVLHVLHSHERRHLSAEEIYQRIAEENGHVGLATIYRVLSQLTEAGLVARHIFNAESGKAVYEINQGNPHDHLICLECERVDEFADDAIVERGRGVAEARGYALSQHHLALYGYCSQCRRTSGRARA